MHYINESNFLYLINSHLKKGVAIVREKKTQIIIIKTITVGKTIINYVDRLFTSCFTSVEQL